MSNGMDEVQGFRVIDRRGQDRPTEVCRVCGCKKVHTKEYNKPTMECISYLRSQIPKPGGPDVES